jgi:hypothetical protein
VQGPKFTPHWERWEGERKRVKERDPG